jgi:hypothetical protein
MPSSGSRRGRRVSDPFRFDQSLLSEVGASHDRAPDLRLAGVDEAGRGCLAGPLVAAAVVLDYSSAPFGGLERLTDSKLMTPEARQSAYPVILRPHLSTGWACTGATCGRSKRRLKRLPVDTAWPWSTASISRGRS